jgi:hypothetical protein
MALSIKSLGSNMTELSANGMHVLFSYETPVAAWINGQYYKTSKKWSKTTTRHINKWLDGMLADEQEQSWFDGLIAN